MHTLWLFVHCLVSFSIRGYRPEGINYLLLGTKMGPPINDCHNLGASHFIAISGIHMAIVTQSDALFKYSQPMKMKHLIDNSISAVWIVEV